MELLTTSLGYLKWHYTRALVATFALWKNILVFLFNFFSIKNLIGNFSTPWKRLADTYPKKFNIKIYSSIFLVNSIMRIVGMFLRSIVILLGLTCCIIYVILLPLSLLIWLALPIVVIYLIITGLILIIFS